MKLSIAAAAAAADPSAFVVWRGFERSVEKVEQYGYDGIELALKSAEEFEQERLASILDSSGIEVSCISTGQVFAASGLFFTHPDPKVRQKTIDGFRQLIAIAHDYGKMVNIGRARGFIPREGNQEETEQLFLEGLHCILEDAEKYQVDIVVEPVDRYEINFLNSVEETVPFLSRISSKRIGVMPDVFHMNIEDRDICESLRLCGNLLKYVHLADSNRRAPGQGHLDFPGIIQTLREVDYPGWCSVEILPYPEPDIAARQAAEYLIPLLHSTKI